MVSLMPATVIVLFLAAVHAAAESLVFPPYFHSYGIRKATPKHLFMFFGPRTFFSDPQGLAAVRLLSWDNPKTAKDDDELTVYGVNAGRHEIIYNTSMWTLGLYGGKGSGNGKFLHPRGIAADEKGNVFVADSGNNRIVRLFNPKSGLQWRGSFGESAGLKGPARTAIDEKARVYATDAMHRRIVVFDTAGKVVGRIPSESSNWSFSEAPTALAIGDGSARYSYARDERAIFCADRNGTRLWKIGFDGIVIAQSQMPAGHSAMYGATDYYHNYWVTDTKKHCIVKFDHQLRLLDIFGTQGDGENQFIEPRGITIFKRCGQIFIAEKKGAQYFWIGTELKEASIEKKGEGAFTLFIRTTEHSLVTLFSAVSGDTVIYFKRSWAPCAYSTIPFATGLEKALREKKLMIKLEPTYSSFSYNSWVYPVKVK